MLDVATQKHTRGSFGVAMSRSGSTGLQEAVSALATDVLNALGSGNRGRGVAEALEDLSPSTITSEVVGRIRGLPDLRPVQPEVTALAQRADDLAALRAGRKPRLERILNEATQSVVGERADRLGEAVDAVFHTDPSSLGECLAEARRGLACLSFDPPDPGPGVILERNVAAFKTLAANRERVIKRAYDNVRDRLCEHSREASDGAVGAIAQALVTCLLRAELPRIEEALARVSSKGSKLVELVQQVTVTLEERRRTQEFELTASRASCVISLEGPTQAELLATLQAHYRCRSEPELVAKVRHLLEQRLRARARTECPDVTDQDSLVRLVMAFSPRQIADELDQLVKEGVGRFSLYEMIQRTGLQQFAENLWDRAGVTCHLGGRDDPRFGVAPLDHAILHLPRPSASGDGPIQEALAAVFRELAGNRACDIQTDGMGQRDVVVVRMRIGWPIGLEEENLNLLSRYVSASRMHHPPHLVGLVPDTPLGQASPSHCALFADIHTEGHAS
ncbi:hypothetical protein OAX78_00400 [Planctomycetota bacterium]|nr:hypothetical protein [Planctomycetota bacterium]